jgi:WhiB family redox-sensing transcriptional regulator
MATPFERPSWFDDAPCRGCTDLFFPDSGGKANKARALCARCDLRDLCLEYALTLHPAHGLWAGFDVKELRQVRRQRNAA